MLCSEPDREDCVRVSIELGRKEEVPWISLDGKRLELPFASMRGVARLVRDSLRQNPGLREVVLGNPDRLRGRKDLGTVIETFREVILASGRGIEFSAKWPVKGA